MNKLPLSEPAAFVISKLTERDYRAYIVGGAVRDFLMGRVPHDYDICTNAEPSEVKAVFSSHNLIETGIKHGTVTVMINSEPIEITTFRTEGSYTDGRHPDSVSFTRDIVADLSRRDFTVNAIAYHPDEGYIDPFGGIVDTENKVIRCVGDPMERFNEDALRILRALRFSSVLSFNINTETENAVFMLKDRLTLVSKERIRDEFSKLISGDKMADILEKFRSVIGIIIPPLVHTFDYDQNNPHHDFYLYTHLVKTVNSLPADAVIRTAGLLHDIGKPLCRSTDQNGISHYYSHAAKSAEISEEILRDLRFSNAEIKRAVTLIRHHDGVIEETESAVKRKLNKLGKDLFFDLLDLQRADNSAQTENPELRLEHNNALREIANSIISSDACTSLASLAVDGNDIIALGYRGKEIGKALSFLLDAVIGGDVKNTKETLITYLRHNFTY